MSDPALIQHYRDLAATVATRDPELAQACSALADRLEADAAAPDLAMAKAAAVVKLLDTLSRAEMRSWTTEDLRRFVDLAYHWSSLAGCELHERRRASIEEESE
jgi:hypothetical protein